jgi:hypothetical protein
VTTKTSAIGRRFSSTCSIIAASGVRPRRFKAFSIWVFDAMATGLSLASSC